jgi:hypothetical protein
VSYKKPGGTEAMIATPPQLLKQTIYMPEIIPH